MSELYRKGWSARIIQALLVVGCSVVLFCYMHFGFESDSEFLSYLMCAICYSYPLIIVVGLYGIRSGIVSYTLILIPTLCFYPADAYALSFQLVLIYIVGFAVSKRLFKSIFKTILFAFLAGIVLDRIEFFVNYIIAENNMSETINKWDFAGTLDTGLTVVTAFVILYLVFRFLPENVSKFFPVGNFRNHIKNEEFEQVLKHKPKHSLAKSFVIILSAEALLLGIGAAFAANTLIPKLGGVIEDKNGNVISHNVEKPDDAPEKPDAKEPGPEGKAHEDNIVLEGKTHRMENILRRKRIGGAPDADGNRFLMNDEGISFDFKMIFFLLEIIMPIVELLNTIILRRTILPITDMAIAMENFADDSMDGKECAAAKVNEIKVCTKDEVAQLHETISFTVNEVIDYIQKVKEEQKLEEDLRVAQRASEAKSSFLSNVSHEIRTPVNAVLGMDEMILRECQDKNIRKYAMNIQNSGRTLISLINDILDFSRIEAGKLDIIPVEYEMSSTLNDLVNMISIKAEEKDIKLEVDVDQEIPHLLIGDEIRIKQCMINILNNAVKYTEKGKVTLTVGFKKKDELHALICVNVKDTGIGMKPEDLEKLCTPFERFEEERNRNIEGTGLGLSIVKHLLGMMGSELNVKSVHGEGSEFGFDVEQEVISWEPMGDFADMYEHSVESIQEYEVLFQAPDARILVVDDTKMNLTVVKGLLEPTRIKIDTAISGRECLEMVKKTKYDIIYLDQRMPGLDGVETLHAMKEMPDAKDAPKGEGNMNPHTPVICLTANAISGARERFLSEGFDDYLTKPIDSKKLESMTAGYIPKYKVLHAGDIGYMSPKELAEAIARSRGPEDKLLKAFMKIPEIDYDAAIENCMREDILREAVRDFTIAAKDGADEIEEFLESGDIKNYTVKVHALKSSARLIGAMTISEEAAHLEKCGDSNNEAEMKAKTPALLEKYRALGVVLSKIADKDKKRKEELPQIDISSLKEAYAGIREYVDAFDFDSVDSIIDTLDGYSMPDGEQERYEKIRDLATRLDHDGLMAELENI